MKIKMVKLTFIIGVLLLALVFQKNPIWGVFVIGIYILFRFRSRRFNSNKGLIESGKKNTDTMVKAINEGFDQICEAITRQDQDDINETDKTPSGQIRKTPVTVGVYKN